MSASAVFKEMVCPGNDYNLALELRRAVLRKPLGLEFTDSELATDLTDRHFGLFSETDGSILACLSVQVAGDNARKIRQVATDPSFQHQGFGLMLAQQVEAVLREEGVKELFCHARETAVPFYARQRYEIVSERFTEVGIPHFKMKKTL